MIFPLKKEDNIKIDDIIDKLNEVIELVDELDRRIKQYAPEE